MFFVRSQGISAYRILCFAMLFLQGKTTTVAGGFQGNSPTHRTRSRVRYLGLLLAVLLLTTLQGMAVEAQSPHQTHIVQTGDTLFSIAQQYNATVGQIRELNHLTQTNVLYVGQALIVPSAFPAGASTPSISSCGVQHPVLFHTLSREVNSYRQSPHALAYPWPKLPKPTEFRISVALGSGSCCAFREQPSLLLPFPRLQQLRQGFPCPGRA